MDEQYEKAVDDKERKMTKDESDLITAQHHAQQKAAEEYLSNQNQIGYDLQRNLYGGIMVQQNPREYLHNFLLQAAHAGINVERFVYDEIEKMKRELER